jgi:ankyrin repeat protein
MLEGSHDKAKVVNLVDNDGFTPLINATIGESEAIIHKLLQLGADG